MRGSTPHSQHAVVGAVRGSMWPAQRVPSQTQRGIQHAHWRLTDTAVGARSQRRQGAAAAHGVMAMEGPRKGWHAGGSRGFKASVRTSRGPV